MAQLGARGVSVFFPSGDSGVGPNGTCVSNDGRNATRFLPVFPPSCPYVTTVGGTMHFSPEVAAFDPPNNYTRGFSNGFYSGGGFSNYFTRPRYQKGVVDTYVASLNGQYDGLYNKNGRGYPDIATQSVAVAAIWNGTLVHIDGTKCGIATSIFALANDALIAKGKPPMGFLNPWLYKRGYAAMNDILHGGSVGCDTAGFPAQKGWDAVTGFGSPMFKRILEQLPGLKRC
jgi:tripeptidyl-peptidase-1